jgi:hypothetical protein
MWLDTARRHFPGTVIVGKDLLEILIEHTGRPADRPRAVG